VVKVVLGSEDVETGAISFGQSVAKVKLGSFWMEDRRRDSAVSKGMEDLYVMRVALIGIDVFDGGIFENWVGLL